MSSPVAAAGSGRLLARRVPVAALLLLGAISGARLPLSYLPAWSLPELRVDLRLPESSDLTELTRRWIVPLESSIRAVGGVRGMAGEVHAAGAGFRVRFAAGSDAERKAARLESELAGLRRRLPAGAGLAVRPSGQGAGDESAIVWLDAGGAAGSGDRLLADDRLIEALRDLPEVRSLRVAGGAEREVRVRARPLGGASAAELTAAIDRERRFRRLGTARRGGRLWPVVVGGGRDVPLGRLPVRRGPSLVPLASVADVELRWEEPPWIAHLEGERGLVLLVSREVEASPLALARSLRRTFADFGVAGRARFLIDEAAPLELLLGRLAWGLAAALTVLAAVSWRLLGWRAAALRSLALPVALAAALNGFWLAGLPLDATTLPALAAGLGAALVFCAFDAGRPAAGSWAMASALALPVAVSLAGGRLAPLLAPPARAFVVAAVAAVAACWLLLPPPPPRLPPRRLTAPLRRALRHPWTVLLGTAVAAYLLFVLSGSALVPRGGSLAPAIGDLAVRLRFADGTTIDQAAAQVAAVEGHLDALDEVTGHWSVFDRREGSVVAAVRRRDRRAVALRRLALRLQLAAVGASARVVPLAASGDGEEPARFTETLEDSAETDDEITSYRFILRHTDARALQRAHARVLERLAALETSIWFRQIHADWGRPAARVELVPRGEADPARVDAAARAVVTRASLPAGRPLTADRDLWLRVTDPGAPETASLVRQRAELLGPGAGTAAEDGSSRLVPGAIFEAREWTSPPAIRRQSGRFTLPITVRISGSIKEWRRPNRAAIHRGLETLRLPPGTGLELPELNPAVWSRERLSLLAIAGALPLLLFALAACRLNALGPAAAALAAPVLAVAAAAPWIQAGRGFLDEMTLLLLGMALVAAFPAVLETAAASGAAGGPLAGGVLYRWLARRAPGLAAAVPALLLLFLVPGLGIDDDRHPWALPLRAAGVAASVACLASFFALPALLRAAAGLRPRRRPELARPPAWRDARAAGGAGAGVLPVASGVAGATLAARRLSKVYGDGFPALHAVDFRLEPGIVGLLGPNGAGKTTLLRLLCGLLEPTRGQVRFRDVPLSPHNLPEYRRLVGFLPQGFDAYEGFTGAAFLDYWAIERGIADPGERRREVERVLADVGLEDAAGRKVRDFSGGMRRRIGIARALLGSPPIVLVDEPTTGLDVGSRNRLRETLLSVAGERVILFSTHIASDVAAAASRILVLDHGRLVYDGAARGLLERARGRVFQALVEDHDLRRFSHRYRVTTRLRTLDGLQVRALVRGDEEPAGELVEPNLEEAYLALIDAGARRHRGGRREGAGAGSLLDLAAWDSRVTVAGSR